MKYDFGGWATRNDLQCADGRVIKKDAFKGQNGQTVPLVWMHNHADPANVLGLAHLENRDEGVYAFCEFNDTESGKTARELVKHGDVQSLSIFANQLKQAGHDVVHGIIREVSLVLAGANPGAFIDDVVMHGDGETGIVIGYNEMIMGRLEHSADELDKKKEEEKIEPNDKSDNREKKDDKVETIEDIFKSMNEKQQTAVFAMMAEFVDKENPKKEDDESKGGDDNMKHNVFDTDKRDDKSFLSHADQEEILKLAKTSQVGTFQSALEIYANENALQHDALASGFAQTGDGNVTLLFPEYKDVRPGAPELITNDQGWITTVMNKVHKSPISRIRTRQADIRNIDTLRAKGYKKGKEKAQAGNFKLVRRTTDPQTVYIKDALNRDDIVDITDFDYVSYLYNIDRMMLNEELATAIMLGDGRDDGDEGKISPDHIRPIWLDDDLYTIHVDLDVAAAKKELQGTNTAANFGENYIIAEAMINTALYARENYKGTGTPDLFITPHMLNQMLLARDINGRRIYSSKAELATALNVGSINTAEQFEGKTRTTSDNKKKKLVAIIANLADYSLGATKGGEVTHFTQFDIDFNQEKSLLETRCSGALTRVYSAIAIEEDVTSASSASEDHTV
ncbi:HK97 family phage prohead protease [Clostridium sp. AM25-23AC]|uniref:HK97 family phage prohead protease n=1 Tax=Clostridium sp. AM25-23AC TaxID=2305240 RepID=UPI000E4270AE|nr:HK97 family phage prohead protease [Clostridium sp. AM25-23AC]RGD94275.1 caudovirus prohead protease [Clostridium sp. AM25-23AC]